MAIGGQKQAQGVSKLIQACKHKLTKLLAQYSELGHSNGEGRQHTIEEVCDLQSTFWICSDHTYSANADPTTAISPATQRRLLELHHFEARAREEKQLLIAESIRRVDVYSKKLDLLRSQIHLSASDVAMAVVNSQWLELQIHASELVNKALVQAYWSDAIQAEAILLAAKRQCKREIILPTQTLHMESYSDAQLLLSSDEDVDTEAPSSDENLGNNLTSSSDLELSD